MINPDEFTNIKQLAIIGLFKNPYLKNRLVLVGGNCIDIAYNLSTRASLDLDFAMEEDFNEDDLIEITQIIKDSYTSLFSEKGYHLFDLDLQKKPKISNDPNQQNWGGYAITFKLVYKTDYSANNNDTNKWQNKALKLGRGKKGRGPKFKIDISKNEYCETKKEKELEDVVIYIASPVMTVCYKLRALCQMMKEYPKNKREIDRPRARDFFDIYIVNTQLADINWKETDNIEILKAIFAVKEVPLILLKELKYKKEVHRDDFESVKTTITYAAESYDFYFNYVISEIEKLEKLRII